MDSSAAALRRLGEMLTVDARESEAIAGRFAGAMEAGLDGRTSSLKMLPAHLGAPTGRERGVFLALDFGGTNIRAARISLSGGPKAWRTLRYAAASLVSPEAGRNLAVAGTPVETIFDWIAGQIALVAGARGRLRLGHTFSYPCRQPTINEAYLIEWTKEMNPDGGPGENITALLDGALRRRGLERVAPAAVINDTVATMLAAAYRDPRVIAGSICGTGHNTCYIEPSFPGTGGPMAVNIEAGNFDGFPRTPYDDALDAGSGRSGSQLLEKAVAGRYLGELFGRVLQDLCRAGVLSLDEQFLSPGMIRAEDLSLALGDRSRDLSGVGAWMAARGAGQCGPLSGRRLVRAVAEYLAVRSARLVAATLCAVLRRTDPGLRGQRRIAIDGALAVKMPGYRRRLARELAAVLGDESGRPILAPAAGGSTAGAAIAAAMAGRRGTGGNRGE